MEKKKIGCRYSVLVIILFAALAFVVDYAVIERKMSKCDCPDCSTVNSNQSFVRTYRFFGYSMTDGPDMYTTLKLHSNGKYDLFLNMCSGVDKISGDYVENDVNITLNGEKNIVLSKIDNGNSLDLLNGLKNVDMFVCNYSSGSFSLEDYMLNLQPTDVID